MLELCWCTRLEKKLLGIVWGKLIFGEFSFNRVTQFFFLKVPDNGVNHLADRLLLFRHDYNSNNILQMISSPSEIIDETLVEIVLTANREFTSNRIVKSHFHNACFFISRVKHSCRLQCPWQWNSTNSTACSCRSLVQDADFLWLLRWNVVWLSKARFKMWRWLLKRRGCQRT